MAEGGEAPRPGPAETGVAGAGADTSILETKVAALVAEQDGGKVDATAGDTAATPDAPQDRYERFKAELAKKQRNPIGRLFLSGFDSKRAQREIDRQDAAKRDVEQRQAKKLEKTFQEANQRTSVEIFTSDGKPLELDKLSPETRAFVQQAQSSLFLNQEVKDFNNPESPDYIEDPKEREDAIAERNAELARESRVIVLNAGTEKESILMAQGDPRGLRITNGKPELVQWTDSIQEQVQRRNADGTLAKDQYGKQLYDYPNVPISSADYPQKISRVNFVRGSTSVPGKGEVPYVLAYTMQADADGKYHTIETPVSDTKDTARIFDDAVKHSVTLTLSKEGVVDAGPDGPQGRTREESRRIGHTLVELQHGDLKLSEGQVVLGAGAEFFGRGGIELANDILKTETTGARPATLVLPQRELDRYKSLTLATQRQVRDFLGDPPPGFNYDHLNLVASEKATGLGDEGVVRLEGEAADFVDFESGVQNARTRDILSGRMSASEIDLLTDESEILLALHSGEPGFTGVRADVKTAMDRVNTQLIELRKTIDAQEKTEGVVSSRRDIARGEIESMLPENVLKKYDAKDEATVRMVDKLISKLAKRNVEEGFGHALDKLTDYKNGPKDGASYRQAENDFVASLHDLGVPGEAARRLFEEAVPAPSEPLTVDSFVRMLAGSKFKTVDEARAMIAADGRLSSADRAIMEILAEKQIKEPQDPDKVVGSMMRDIMGSDLTREQAVDRVRAVTSDLAVRATLLKFIDGYYGGGRANQSQSDGMNTLQGGGGNNLRATTPSGGNFDASGANPGTTNPPLSPTGNT